MSNPTDAPTTNWPTWEPGIDMVPTLVSTDDSETLVLWLRRIAGTPDLRVRGGAYVECQPAMVEEVADELDRLRAALAIIAGGGGDAREIAQQTLDGTDGW